MHDPRTPAQTPLDPTSLRSRNHLSTPGSRQHRQTQLWEATSADGRWLYLRTEESGTPWRAFRLVDGHPGEHSVPAASLRAARELTATGVADHHLDQRAAGSARPRCTWRSPWGTATVCSRTAGPGGRCDNPAHALAVAS